MFGWPGGGFYCFGCQTGGRSPEDFARMRLPFGDGAEEADDAVVAAWLSRASVTPLGQLDLPFMSSVDEPLSRLSRVDEPPLREVQGVHREVEFFVLRTTD